MVVAYADALRLELSTHVGVATVYPSAVRSLIHNSTRTPDSPGGMRFTSRWRAWSAPSSTLPSHARCAATYRPVAAGELEFSRRATSCSWWTRDGQPDAEQAHPVRGVRLC